MSLLKPLAIGARSAPNRIMFGPHVTNLGDDNRSFTPRHVAYYERRARGGCGIIVTEGASVHESDWPYERAPLASACADGWRAVADAVHRHGSLVVASLDHAGGQGSSAYSQLPLWAPSRVPEVNTREVPKWMEASDIDAVIDGFATSAALAVEAGCDGVEINAGQHSLVRQFMSGLTNQRGDEYADRFLFVKRVIDSVRSAVGRDAVVGLRLSGDELAPWAGITPDMAPAIAAELCAHGLDYLVVVRGSIFSVEKTRPDFHEAPGFNIDVCRAVRATVPPAVAVFLQGSIVDWNQAQWAADDGVCDGVEMTRAQIADPDLVTKVREGTVDRIRPCILCNQTCQVRDARNPIVTCIGEPTSGHESDDPDWYAPASTPTGVTVIGGGVAGLEAARVAATRGHRVRLMESSSTVGGLAAAAGPGRALVDWLEREVTRLGVAIETGVDGCSAVGDRVIQATGSVRGRCEYSLDGIAVDEVVDVADLRRGLVTLPEQGDVVILDPIGGPIAVALAEELGPRAHLVTQDNIAGNELSRSGDLAPANVRLAQRGVTIHRRSVVRSVARNGLGFSVRVQDRFSGELRDIPGAAIVDCGFRLPSEPIPGATAVGDAVAPRTILEAVLEARRAAHSI